MTRNPVAALRDVLDPVFAAFDPDRTDVLDATVVSEHVEFTPGPPQRLVPPVGWVPVNPDEPTPIFDTVNTDVQHPRTPTGRVSKRAPRLPYTGGLSYDTFLWASRRDHHTWHGGETGHG